MSQKSGQFAGDARLIEALAQGMTQAQAATATGYCARTIRRRLELDDFRALVIEARSAMLTQATGRLAAASAVAVTTLVKLALSANSEMVRARCARSILELNVRFRETEELAERLSRLEAAAGTS